MTALIKKDLIDLAKVNVPSWMTIAWVQAHVGDVNTLVQETGTSMLILATLAYTIFKAVDMFRHMKWAKEDRNDKE